MTTKAQTSRQSLIIEVLQDAFSDLMRADPHAFRVKFRKMAAGPFAFYRGAAAVMAADLADVPRTGLTVQLCGDAHLSNFGTFAAPDRRLVFSINDFDETLPGPFEWDVKRLVGSLAVVGRTGGFTPPQRRTIELAAAQSYREAMRDFSTMGSLQLWYTRLDVDEIAARVDVDRVADGEDGRARVERLWGRVAARGGLAAHDAREA